MLSRFAVPVVLALTLVICVSAKSFTATCNYKDASKKSKGGKRRVGHRFARRRGYGVGSQVRGSRKTRPALYGVKTNTIDVVMRVFADDSVTAYINGETNNDWSTANCYESVNIPATLTGGDVLSFVAENGPGDYGLDVAVTSAGGDQTHVTTGQAGWKGVPYDQAGSGWMQPGFDDSDWPDLVAGVMDTQECSPPHDISSTGAIAMWTSPYSNKIAVRYVVPTPTPTPTPTPNQDCACTEGACDDGYCHYCLFDEGQGHGMVCYADWTENECNAAGSDYKWCGN